jgi:hypothetical protein
VLGIVGPESKKVFKTKNSERTKMPARLTRAASSQQKGIAVTSRCKHRVQQEGEGDRLPYKGPLLSSTSHSKKGKNFI